MSSKAIGPGAVITTRELRRTFKSRRGPVEAVAGVSLEVNRGEIFGFLGPNGAGKTTTLRMLATLLPPTSGEATVVGQDLLRNPAGVRDRIGYVGQLGGADPEVTGRGSWSSRGASMECPALPRLSGLKSLWRRWSYRFAPIAR